MADVAITTIQPQPTAVVRGEVPAGDLPAFFERAFHAVLDTTARQGITVTGPPFGLYPRMPGATVAVAAGFPVSAPVTADGDVTALELPGGRAVTTVHVGSFETLTRAYGDLVAWATAQGVELGPQVWETYLTDPAAEPDPERWETRITWPLA